MDPKFYETLLSYFIIRAIDKVNGYNTVSKSIVEEQFLLVLQQLIDINIPQHSLALYDLLDIKHWNIVLTNNKIVRVACNIRQSTYKLGSNSNKPILNLDNIPSHGDLGIIMKLLKYTYQYTPVIPWLAQPVDITTSTSSIGYLNTNIVDYRSVPVHPTELNPTGKIIAITATIANLARRSS